VLFFAVALLIIISDQLTKWWIRSNLALGQSIFDLGFFRLTYIHNSGAAFGIFPGQSLPLAILSMVGIVILLVCAYAIYFRHFAYLNNRLDKVALGLILGGTVGNLIDRLRLGYVTDFISFNLWPAFNIADSAVTIGVVLFVCSLLFILPTRKK
jgi:signal peptidase II